jgi:hypothetical protein
VRDSARAMTTAACRGQGRAVACGYGAKTREYTEGQIRRPEPRSWYAILGS